MSPETALLLSRASAAVSWRAWEFAVALVLFDLSPKSLTLVAAFGLADTFVQAVTGPTLGHYVDRTDRFRSAITMYIVQHALIVISCLAAAAAFLFAPESACRIGFIVFTVVSGVLAGAGATGSMLSVEQVWVVAVCGSDAIALTKLNSKMRAVDLCALLFAPLGAAAILQYAGTWIFVLCFAAYSAATFFPEALMLRVAGSALASRKAAEAASPAQENSVDVSPDTKLPAPSLVPALSSANIFMRICNPLALYARQTSAPLMIALALLYFTVLSFHGVMTAYLQSEGSSDLVISLFRGGGAVFGLLSTLVFPFATRLLDLSSIAAISILFQLVFIALGAVPLALDLLPSREVQLYVFQGGVAVSRLGLWLADLAIMQFIQETTSSDLLGTVQGTGRSVCAVFELLSYVAALVFAQPSQFPVLMLGSLAAVGLAAAICVYFALSRARKQVSLAVSSGEPEPGEGERTPLMQLVRGASDAKAAAAPVSPHIP